MCYINIMKNGKEIAMKIDETMIGQRIYGNDNGRLVMGTVHAAPGGFVGIRWDHIAYTGDAISTNCDIAYATRDDAETAIKNHWAMHERRKAAAAAAKAQKIAAGKARAREWAIRAARARKHGCVHEWKMVGHDERHCVICGAVEIVPDLP
jgi:hypothetical protein